MISNLSFLLQVFFASLVEYIGDSSFKLYTRLKSNWYFLLGIIAYIILVFQLIKILSYSNVMQMNIQWDAISVILETILAYLLLGEILSEKNQWIGFFLIVSGLIFMNIGKRGYK